MKVRNLNKAVSSGYDSGGWLTYWEKFSGQAARECFVSGCKNARSVGGHVQKDSSTDKSWYVVPLCDDCNRKTGQDLEIWDLAMLVPANITRIKRPVPHSFSIRSSRAAGSFP